MQLNRSHRATDRHKESTCSAITTASGPIAPALALALAAAAPAAARPALEPTTRAAN